MSEMPKAFADEDPFEMVVARYPVESGVDADRELVRCIVEEYALIGWPARRIRRLFDSPAYPALRAIRDRREAAFIDEIVGIVFGTEAR